MYGESFVTYCGYDDYIIDLDMFPNLKDKDINEITKWLYDNSEKLCVNEDYVDNNPRSEMGPAREIIPYNDIDILLIDTLGANGVKWEKIKDEDRYFIYARNEKNEENEVSS